MLTVAFLNQNYLMQKEIIAALKRVNGIRLAVIVIPDIPSDEQAQAMCDALTQHNCAIVISVNDWGIDRSGITASFCESNGIVHVNWCADDPFYLSFFYNIPIRFSKNRIDFVSDRSYVVPMRKAGMNAYFLPLATDPQLFMPDEVSQVYLRTACFVGNSYNRQIDKFTKDIEPFIDSLIPFLTALLAEHQKNCDVDISDRVNRKITTMRLPTGVSCDKAVFIVKHVISYFYRKRFIESIAKAFSDFMVFGDEFWLLDIPQNQVSLAVAYYDNLCETYRQTKVNVDINRVVIREGLTQRVFDCLAAHSFVITSKKNIVQEFFVTEGDKREVVMFDSDAHALELIRYFAAHDSEREAIVKRGRDRVLAQHTYDCRMREMLSVVSREIGKVV